MSGVTIQGGIDAIQAKKETIEFKVMVPNASVADSALVAWLVEAQRNGTLLTLDLVVNEADEQTQSQLRLFEDLVVENAPLLSTRQVVAAAVKATRRQRHSAETPAVSAEGDGEDPSSYSAEPSNAEDLSTD